MTGKKDSRMNPRFLTWEKVVSRAIKQATGRGATLGEEDDGFSAEHCVNQDSSGANYLR